MADEIDQTAERMDFDTSIDVRNICAKAEKFNVGQPGDCNLCGEHFQRVVPTVKNDEDVLACGRCRDKHGLK